MITGELLLSMKEIMNFAMEELVVGSSSELILTKMLNMSCQVHFLLSPLFGSFKKVKVSKFTSLSLEVMKRDSMMQQKIQ